MVIAIMTATKPVAAKAMYDVSKAISIPAWDANSDSDNQKVLVPIPKDLKYGKRCKKGKADTDPCPLMR